MKQSLEDLDIVVVVFAIGDDLYTTHLYGNTMSEEDIKEFIELSYGSIEILNVIRSN